MCAKFYHSRTNITWDINWNICLLFWDTVYINAEKLKITNRLTTLALCTYAELLFTTFLVSGFWFSMNSLLLNSDLKKICTLTATSLTCHSHRHSRPGCKMLSAFVGCPLACRNTRREVWILVCNSDLPYTYAGASLQHGLVGSGFLVSPWLRLACF